MALLVIAYLVSILIFTMIILAYLTAQMGNTDLQQIIFATPA